MPDYRLYTLDRKSARICHVEEFEAQDDASAIGQVQCRARREAMEMWCGKRKVQQFEPSEGLGRRVPPASEPQPRAPCA